MKRILKAAFFCFMLLSIAAFWKHSTVKAAETLTEGKTYKIDLNGDGKKEKVKYTFSGNYDDDYCEEYTSFTFKLYINGKDILNQETYNYTLVDSDTFSKSYTSYMIRPRNVLLSVFHKF